MTVNYTTNLSLGQPVTGTESGTWGDDVNNAVTSYLDIAIAGGLAITVTTADVTLTITQGTSVATNIGSTTAQYAILNVSGAMTAARNLIVPSSSRIYLVNNNTTGGFALTVKGSATSGVTLVNGEKAHVFWNGTDYAKLSNASGGAGVFSSITNSGLTSGRVVYSTTGGLETDSANLTFNGTTLTANTIGAFTLSGTIAGGGNQINNVIIGTTTPLAGAFTTLSASGAVTLSGGTANGVTYLNASKVLTSGTALTFDGTSLGQGVTASSDYGFRQIFTGSGAVSQYGIHLDAFSDSSGTGNTIGIRAKARTSAAVYTSTSVIDFLADTIGLGAGSTITVAAGFLASDQTVGGTNIGFYSVVSSGANKYNIYASGTAQNYFSGSVGIGIVTPSAKFEVAGTGTTTLVKNTTTTAANGLQTNSTGGNFYFGIDSSTNNFYNTGTPYGRAIYSDGAYPIVFFTNATSRMTLDSSGNLIVGGTSNSGAKLTVLGATSDLWAASSSDGLAINGLASGISVISTYLDTSTLRIGAGVTQKTGLLITGNTSGSGSTVQFRTGNAETMRLDSSGNLGIGTTAPGYALDVQKNVSSGVLANFQSTNTAAVYTGIAFRSAATNTAARNWSLTMNNNAFGDFAIRTSTAINGDPIAAGTDRLVINASGDITVSTGNIIQGTAAKGINFTANTATAGSTSQLLNWYEEGTWTPSVGGTATYTVQEGFFTRIGRQVTVTGKIIILVIGTGSQSTISGLPFTAASPSNGSYGTGAVGYFLNLASSVVSITAFVATGTKTILFNTLAAAGATATNSPNIMTSTTRIDFSATYFV